MPNWSTREKEYIDSFIERDRASEAIKPRTDCPKHGRQVICIVCKKCLACVKDESIQRTIAFCRRVKHTLFKSSAPCKRCRWQIEHLTTHIVDNPMWSACSDCFSNRQSEIEKNLRSR